MPEQLKYTDMEIGVVGLGLMGSSIVVALLLAGHPVRGIAPIPSDLVNSLSNIKAQLEDCDKANLLDKPLDSYLNKLTISQDYSDLSKCVLVLECVIEKPEIKKQVYDKIETFVADDTVIASNTSAIPITQLQKTLNKPERFIGIHWAEPAFVTRFLEVTCGENTRGDIADRTMALAHFWKKEPTLLRKDIRGFITNRLMYAVYRELLNLVEKGNGTIEDADKAFRYDAGSWMTLMGVFRRMDFTGLEDSLEVLQNHFPDLSNTVEVPRLMQEMMESNLRGIQTLKGFYTYGKQEAKEWEEAFAAFNKDIFEIRLRKILL